jgi:hypothetical protein
MGPPQTCSAPISLVRSNEAATLLSLSNPNASARLNVLLLASGAFASSSPTGVC